MFTICICLDKRKRNDANEHSVNVHKRRHLLCTRHIDIPAQAFAKERAVSHCLLQGDGREISYASAEDAGTTDSSPRLSEDFPLERHALIPISVVFLLVIPSFLHILLVEIAGYSMFVMILTWLSCTSTEEEWRE